MIVRAIDTNGDWTYGQGLNNYLTSNDAIAQEIYTNLNCFLGDCFSDITRGVDWWNLLGSKNPVGLNLAVNAVILNTEGVTGIQQILIDLDPTRNLTLEYTVTTIYGNTLTRSIGFVLLTTEDGVILTTESGDELSA